MLGSAKLALALRIGPGAEVGVDMNRVAKPRSTANITVSSMTNKGFGNGKEPDLIRLQI